MLLCRHHIQRVLPICTLLLFCAFVTQETRARPFSQERRGRRNADPFPDGIPTEDGSKAESCYKPITETFANGSVSRIVNECCEGYAGDDCNEKVSETAAGAGAGEGKVEFDPVDPCKGLECMGVDDTQCFTISKCGERWPVFLMNDGTLAECKNGQPVDVSRLTCTGRCAVDPCLGQTCGARPDAICMHTACNCHDPMWILGDGVQVDCDTGEFLSPEEAKSRRRRKRQTTSSTPPPTQQRPCS